MTTRRTITALLLLAIATIAWAASGCIKPSGGEQLATGTPAARATRTALSTETAVPATATVQSVAGTSGQTRSTEPPAPPTASRQPGERGLYIALGDSLSAGAGASDASKTFVSLVHASLGAGMQLLNLGVGGHTSQDLLDSGNVDRAVSEIRQRKANGDPNDDVQVVTLEIGGNDLLGLFVSLVLPGTCPDVQTSSTKPECVDALRATFDRYRPNLSAALDRLQAADAGLPVLLLTQYNPLQHLGAFGELGVLSLEGLANTPFVDGLNDIMRQVAQGRGSVSMVDVYASFQGRSVELVSGDLIHPNDAGYQVMADAIIGAIAALRAR